MKKHQISGSMHFPHPTHFSNYRERLGKKKSKHLYRYTVLCLLNRDGQGAMEERNEGNYLQTHLKRLELC